MRKSAINRKLPVLLLIFFAPLVFFNASMPVLAQEIEDESEEIITPKERNKDLRLQTPYYSESSDSCGSLAGSGSANTTVPKDFTLGKDPAERRSSLIKALASDFGLTEAQAAGPVGNFMTESGGEDLPPDVNEGGAKGPPRFKGGYGWAQWTAGRQKTFIQFAIDQKLIGPNENATDAANYAYLKYELTTGYKSTIDELKKVNSSASSAPEDAAVSFEATFEKAGVKALEKRKAAARKAFDELTKGSGSSSSSKCGNSSAGCVDDYCFPLLPTKSMVKNPNMFSNNTADKGGHPYTAYDILAEPGTKVAAFYDGIVTRVGKDRCPGRFLAITNGEKDQTISYMHLDFENHVPEGTKVTKGQEIAIVGPAPNGCGTPHLHIDSIKGKTRLGCSRKGCSASTKALFVDIGPQLFKAFQVLPD